MENKRWPVLAQILIALGCGGGLISLYTGFVQKNWTIVGLGLLMTIAFWFFYQFQPWAQKMVTVILGAVLLTDIVSVVTGAIEMLPGVLAIIFRGLILFYFNSKPIKALFEAEEL